MSWLDTPVSLYKCPADNTGRPATFREILFCEFAITHEWYYKQTKPEEKWISGIFNDLSTIIDLRTSEMTKEEKGILKNTMQCFTPAALLRSKKASQVVEISRTGLMQLDFDAAAIEAYNIEELKDAVFSLPFIAFCGLSCSGKGFYALAAIAEPDKLQQYAEHCFETLTMYAVPPDTTKGRNITDLRFLSYDRRMLYREQVEPLRIKRFKAQKKPSTSKSDMPSTYTINHSNKVVSNGLNRISAAVEGSRWQTVQQVAYTFGGLQDDTLLEEIKKVIKHTAAFAGVEQKYNQCAIDCFSAGKAHPLNIIDKYVNVTH